MRESLLDRVNYGNQSECLNVSASRGSVCNNFCMFCVDSHRHRFDVFEKDERNVIYKIIRENRGLKKICFGGGGEPTLSPHLINYVQCAHEQGYREIAVVSNGRQYGDVQYCLDLVWAGVREFTISIHGHDALIHDALTCSPGSFEQTLNGLRNFSRIRQTLPIRINVSHVVNKVNYRFLDKFLGLMGQYFVDIVILNTVQPRGDNMARNFSILMPRYKDVARKIENIFFKRSELMKSKLSPFEWFVSVVDMPICVSERLRLVVRAGGLHLICGVRNHEVQIRDGDQEHALFAARRNTNVPLKKKRRQCVRCRYDSVCEGVFRNYVKHFGWGEFCPITN